MVNAPHKPPGAKLIKLADKTSNVREIGADPPTDWDIDRRLKYFTWAEREKIWKVQIHPTKTPLADDVNFRELAERYEVSGGDIKNAVLKAATMAAALPGLDLGKRIHQSEFTRAMDEVVEGRGVMQQSLFGEPQQSTDDRLMKAVQAAEVRWQKTGQAAIAIGSVGLILGIIAVVIALVR